MRSPKVLGGLPETDLQPESDELRKEHPVIGQLLGRYRVVAKIGEGGMGVVYRGHDEVLHRDVALKVVRKDAQIDLTAGKTLLQEARASSSLAHPNICTIYEVGETNGEFYIAM